MPIFDFNSILCKNPKNYKFMSKEIIYRKKSYSSVSEITDIAKFQATRNVLYGKNNSQNKLPSIILREYEDGKAFLSYRGTTLVPGTESQLLAKKTAEIADSIGNTGHFTAIDVGTGCGIFATYLAEALSANPESQVIATDISGAALNVAELNFSLNNLNRPPILRKRDILTDISSEFGKINLIVSNPPFIPETHVPQNGFEPTLANNGGADGMDFYYKLAKQCLEILTSNSVLVLQITNLNFNKVLTCIDSVLPYESIGYLKNHATNKFYGLIVGANKNTIKRFSTGMIS